MKNVALDTNLLVLLIVGRSAPTFIARHKRLQAYNVADFALLVAILEKARDLIIIPQSIAEVSNLSTQGVSEPLRSEILAGLRTLVGSATEREVMSNVAVAQREYLRLGVTDAAWLAAFDPETTLVT